MLKLRKNRQENRATRLAIDGTATRHTFLKKSGYRQAQVTNTASIIGTNQSIRLLTYNIQVGIPTKRYHQYLTKGWKHVFPHIDRYRNLDKIAAVCRNYDLVALQEVDAGSLRSGYVDQVEYLANSANFPYWFTHCNRKLGHVAQHGNGLLSRFSPRQVEDHKLPGVLPGRGAIVARFSLDAGMEGAGDELVVVLLHLSLGMKSRELQLRYVRRLIDGCEHVVVMGDMNSHLKHLLKSSPLAGSGLQTASSIQPTYPSWRPAVAIDHVLVSPSLVITNYEVLANRLSDHLPTAVTIRKRTLVEEKHI